MNLEKLIEFRRAAFQLCHYHFGVRMKNVNSNGNKKTLASIAETFLLLTVDSILSVQIFMMLTFLLHFLLPLSIVVLSSKTPFGKLSLAAEQQDAYFIFVQQSPTAQAVPHHRSSVGVDELTVFLVDHDSDGARRRFYPPVALQ